MVYKNSTNSKKSQLKELARYCEYEKRGHTIVIKSRYTIPLPKEKNTKNAVYIQLIESLLLDMLAQEYRRNKLLHITKSKLISSLGFVNKNYFSAMHKKSEIALLIGSDSEVVQDFYNTCQGSFKKTIKAALDCLSDRSMIHFTTVYKVNENGQSSRVATAKETEAILVSQKKILQEFGCTKLSQIRAKGKKVWRDFESKVNKELYLYNNISSYFQVYEIILNSKHIEDECISMLELLLKEPTRIKYIQEINIKACARLLQNAKKRHIDSSQNVYRNQSKYIDDINKLIDILIKHDTESISEELREIDVSTLDEKTNEEIALIFS
ncbi:MULTISPECIES: hypothetical protein [unclassified Bacillus (in: firmicutes)]